MMKLIAAYISLILLLAAAVAVPYLHLTEGHALIASFAIAATKMLVIVTIFMQLFKGSRLYALSFALGFFFLVLLLIGTSLDLFSRPFS